MRGFLTQARKILTHERPSELQGHGVIVSVLVLYNILRHDDRWMDSILPQYEFMFGVLQSMLTEMRELQS